MSQIKAQQERLLEAANRYLKENLDLIALSGKKPLDKEWTDTDKVNYTQKGIAHAIAEGHNIGHRIPRGNIIIDVDPKNGGLKSWQAITTRFVDIAWLNETVLTPSGGFHVYTNLPADFDPSLRLPKTLHDYPGIDFLKAGNQAVIPGSMGANGKPYRWAPQATFHQECPRGLYDLLREGNPKTSSMTHLDEKAREQFYSRNGWGILSAEELGKLLVQLAPENYREYTQFFSVMAACHFATAGDSEAEDVFAAWATLDPLYADQGEALSKHWASLSKSGSSVGNQPITTMTLIHQFKQIGAMNKVQYVLSRLGSRLREGVSFGPVGEPITEQTTEPTTEVTDSPPDQVQKWKDKLALINNEADIIGPFMRELSESADIMPAQLELLFLEIKKRTGIGIGTLREDYQAHSRGVGSFMDNMNDQRETVTQAMIMVSSISRMGGRGLFMFCQGLFMRWKGNGRWEIEDPMIVQQQVMETMTELNFPAVTAGSIASITKMITIQCYREADIWEQGEGTRGKRDKFAAQAHPMINLTDGELRLTKGDEGEPQWSLTKHKPQSYKKIMLPIRWNKRGGEHECPVWENFIEESLWDADDEEVSIRKKQLATFVAYSLIESAPWMKKAIYLYGPPDTGKSVVLDVLTELLGGAENVSDLDITQVGSRFGPANLVGKLANIASEIARGEMINDGVFKSIISGDGINVEKKGQDGFSFANKAVFWFAGNNLPRSRDKSGAIESRILYLPFNWTVPVERRDPCLRDKLLGELDGIAQWALKIFAEEWVKDYAMGIINIPTDGQKKVMAEWRDESDPSRIWFRDSINVIHDDDLTDEDARRVGTTGGVTGFLDNKAIYANYKKWCADTGHIAMTSNHLGRSISSIVKELAGSLRGRDRSEFLATVKSGTRTITGSRNTERGWRGLSLARAHTELNFD